MNKIQRNLNFLTWGRKSFLSRSVRNHDFPAEKQSLKVEVLIIIPTVLHLAAKPSQLELEITSDWSQQHHQQQLLAPHRNSVHKSYEQKLRAQTLKQVDDDNLMMILFSFSLRI